MALIERLAILIDANSSGATREFRKLSTEAKATDTQLTRGQRASQAFAGSLKVMGGLAGGAAVVGLAKLADQSIDAASNLEEVRQKAEQVFEGSFKGIEKFAEGAADALGLSTRQALEFTSAFGNLFTSAGFNERKAAEFSERLTILAADLASFNNISVDEAFQKLQSGLSGEAEPLRKVGVFLSAAKVEAEAYESGIAEVGSTLTEAQKIQARYNIILDETTKAQGDVERTADSLANSQRRLSATTEDLQAKMGEDLMPIKADVVSFFASIASAAGDLDDSLKTVGDGSTGLADLLLKGPLTRAIENIVNAWSDSGETVKQEAIPPLDDFAAATRRTVDALNESKPSVEGFSGTLAYIGDEAEQAESAIELLADAVDRMRSPVLDVRDANREFADAIEHYHDVMASGESTRRQQEKALDDIAEAAFDVLDANVGAKASEEELRAETERLRGELVKAKAKYDDNATAAERYANKVGLIPEDVITNIRLLNIERYTSKARELAGAINGIPRNVAVNVLVTEQRRDAARASNAGTGYQRAAGGSVGPRTYLVGEQGPELVTMRGTGTVMSNAKTRVANVSSGGGDTYNITVNTGNPKVAASEVVSRLRARSFLMGV